MDLCILRHGKAGVADHSEAGDAGRRLTGPGREEIARIGEWMRAREMKFSIIASSPLTRAAETASLIAQILGGEVQVSFWDELAIGPPPEAVLEKLREVPPNTRILLVGHEPQISSLISLLICNCRDCGIVMKKGGIARIRLERWPPGGELLWLLPPGLTREWGKTKK